jgi:hypothetical protein
MPVALERRVRLKYEENSLAVARGETEWNDGLAATGWTRNSMVFLSTLHVD